MNKQRLLGALAVLGLAAIAHSDRLIAVDSARVLYEIDRTTGAKVSIGTVSANAGTTGGLAYDPSSGTLYLTSTGNDSLYTLDLATGTATLVGFYGDASVVMHGIEWDSSTGTLYGGSNGNLYTLDTTTGVATLVGASGTTSFFNLVYDSSTDTLYGTSSSTDSFYSVNRTSGSATLIGPLGPGSTNPNGMAYDPVSDTIYLIDNSTDNLLTVDRVTGVATVVGSTGSGNLLGLVLVPDVSAFPEFCNGDGSGTLCPCGNNNDGSNGVAGCANSAGAGGGKLVASGTNSIAAGNLVLSGSTLQPGQAGLYLQGNNATGGGNGTTFGDGLRCAGGGVVRLQIRNSGMSGSSFTTVNIGSIGGVAPGDVKRYQLWFRDTAGPCGSGFNFTNGVEVTWAP